MQRLCSRKLRYEMALSLVSAGNTAERVIDRAAYARKLKSSKLKTYLSTRIKCSRLNTARLIAV